MTAPRRLVKMFKAEREFYNEDEVNDDIIITLTFMSHNRASNGIWKF